MGSRHSPSSSGIFYTALEALFMSGKRGLLREAHEACEQAGGEQSCQIAPTTVSPAFCQSPCGAVGLGPPQTFPPIH